MGGFGWHNPWPLEWGGGRTLVEKHYDFLRRAPGRGGVAQDEEESFDALWRQQKAVAMAALEAFAERALYEAFPQKSTSWLPYYEDLLGLAAAPGESDEDRRREVARAFTREARSDVPSLTEQLAQIDPRFSVLEVPWDKGETTYEGRSFEPYVPGALAFGGGRKSTVAPNYSTAFDVVVYFDLAASGDVPVPGDARLMDDVERFLNDVLGSWVEFRIISNDPSDPLDRFILDSSPLDITGFGQ